MSASEIITEDKIIDQAWKLLSLKNIRPEKSYLTVVSGNMVSEVMQYGGWCLGFSLLLRDHSNANRSGSKWEKFFVQLNHNIYTKF